MAAKQRRIVVTGAGRGLGRELAQRFVDAGHLVWGTDRGGEALAGAAGQLTLDHQEEASIVAAAQDLATQTSGLDLLVNCAGADARAFGASQDGRGPLDIDAESFNSVMQVNVTGPMLVTRHMLGLLRAGENAMIINISSQLGSMQIAREMGSGAAYCVSKAALNMLSLKTASELSSDRIGVVMLHPGWLNTDMGGPDAALDVRTTSQTIAETIGSLSFDDSGRFIRWDGTDHPW